MVDKAVLDQAKAFLCWDAVQGISVQLVALSGVAAYFYPPDTRQCSIVVFYNNEEADCSGALYYLFHEAGHAVQFQMMKSSGTSGDFRRLMNIYKGEERVAFEAESWQLGRSLLEQFIQKQELNQSLLAEYDQLAAESLQTYS